MTQLIRKQARSLKVGDVIVIGGGLHIIERLHSGGGITLTAFKVNSPMHEHLILDTNEDVLSVADSDARDILRGAIPYADLISVVDSLALALKVASSMNEQGVNWGADSRFQKVIDDALDEARKYASIDIDE